MNQEPEAAPKVDLSKAPVSLDIPNEIHNIVNPDNNIELSAKVNELDAKSRIGYHLSRIVLAIISVFLIFLILYILLGKANGPSKIEIPNQLNLSDSTFNRKLSLIKIAQEENKASRDFVLQITQMVLLNLLLPILTAILGYIFGSRSEGNG